MRNTEVIVVATDKNIIKQLYQTICEEINDENEEIVFGFLPIDDQLQINLYGFEWKRNSKLYHWDKLCRKILGAIVIYDWQDDKSVDLMRQTLRFFEANFEIPLITASMLNGAAGNLPIKLYRGGLPVSSECRFSFFDPKSPASIRELIVGLININLEIISKG